MGFGSGLAFHWHEKVKEETANKVFSQLDHNQHTPPELGAHIAMSVKTWKYPEFGRKKIKRFGDEENVLRAWT